MDFHTHKRHCEQYCDIGYIIKDHVKVIMQLLTNDLPNFNWKLQTTKCLNTAIMLMFFLIGNKGLNIADACDSRAVTTRHTNGQEDNEIIIKSLYKQLFSKRERSRTIYYILMTDGYFPQANTSNGTKYFPGHVFLLEKIYDSTIQQHVFYFYQSYINKYTLNDHIRMNKGLKISLQKTKQLINDLSEVIKAQTWDKENVRRWYQMTFADSSDLQNAQSHNRFYLCFRKTKTTTCLQRLERYLRNKHRSITKLAVSSANDIYGDTSLYEH